MRHLLFTALMMLVMHGGVGALQPHQPPTGAGFGAYMRTMVNRGPAGYSGGAAYNVVAFGESVPRPPSASVKYGW